VVCPQKWELEAQEEADNSTKATSFEKFSSPRDSMKHEGMREIGTAGTKRAHKAARHIGKRICRKREGEDRRNGLISRNKGERKRRIEEGLRYMRVSYKLAKAADVKALRRPKVERLLGRGRNCQIHLTENYMRTSYLRGWRGGNVGFLREILVRVANGSLKGARKGK